MVGRIDDIRGLLSQVMDPEIPVLSILDLGILREVSTDGRKIHIIITPTYSGCPAMDMIRAQIRMTLLQAGLQHFEISTVLSPAWTTDWISPSGKEKLEAYGIAPPTPARQRCHTDLFQGQEAIRCPRCHSYHTSLVSQFGSTACKSLYRCEACKEPFDHFKCH